MQLSVVVPVLDEADNIQPLIDEIVATLDGRQEFEIVYVDDGSSDGTPAELAASQQRLGDRLRVLRHPHPCGQSTALYNGVRAARNEWIATLDGDGQNPPADIATLVDYAGSHDVDLVMGHRHRRNDSFVRLLSSRVANGVRRWLLKDDTPDTGCGLKLFRRETFIDLPYFDHMHRFLPALVQRAGGKVASVPVGHRARERGTSKYGIGNRLWVGIVDLFGVAWLLRRERRPSRVEESKGEGSQG